MTEIVPWYRKVYYGAKAQRMWQMGIGGGVLLTMVFLPAWYEYWMGVQKEKHVHTLQSANRSEMQKMVFDKRMEFRKQVKEGTPIKLEKM